MSSLDDLLGWPRGDDDVHRLELPADWAQGRAIFGGVIAGAALRAMQGRVADDRRPRSFHGTFIGPVAPGEAQLSVAILGEGRSASHVEARVLQGGQLRFVATATLAADRPSELDVAPPRCPLPAPTVEVPDLPFVEGVTPAFTQHFVYRYTRGGAPYSGQARPELGGWIRLRAGGGSLDAAAVLALMDAWPPPPVLMSNRPFPSSSASLSATFTLPDEPLSLADAYAFLSSSTWTGRGWADLEAGLWTAGGRQLARMTQLFALFG